MNVDHFDQFRREVDQEIINALNHYPGGISKKEMTLRQLAKRVQCPHCGSNLILENRELDEVIKTGQVVIECPRCGQKLTHSPSGTW